MGDENGKPNGTQPGPQVKPEPDPAQGAQAASGPRPVPTLVGAEPVLPEASGKLEHLQQNRHLIVKRALLSTALGALIPIPVMDEYVAGRIRAGLLVKIAAGRMVDLPSSAADLIVDPREVSKIRNATLTAATLVALRLAWRKFFALLAVGRGAEEMATTFQLATLFDHYCAKVHVGGPIDREQAAELRKVLHASMGSAERSALVKIFRDGGRVLGRSLLEAPRWLTARITTLAQRWVTSGGNPNATFDVPGDVVDEAGEAQWLDRASRAVEAQLSGIGNGYLLALLETFEARWQERPAPRPASPPAASTPD
jgi:hypothetical protein